MYKQSTPSCNIILAVNPSYTPGHAMNFSGSANISLNFWTAVTGLSPLLCGTEPIFPNFNVLLSNTLLWCFGLLGSFSFLDSLPIPWNRVLQRVYQNRGSAANMTRATQEQGNDAGPYRRRKHRVVRKYSKNTESQIPSTYELYI